jgi:quercetin dioxygenase-like cupin family protein
MFVPAEEPEGELRSHEGYEWMYVLSGRLRLRFGELDLILKAGEVAEFDTHTRHWFGSAGSRPVELLVLVGLQGERMHVRARNRRGSGSRFDSKALISNGSASPPNV